MTDRTLTELSWPAVCARRMARHGLLQPVTDPAAAVAAMCGAHAQIPSAAELSVALRLDGATRTDVRRALGDEATLVRTFGPRGTVHLLAAADLPMWTGALAAVPTGTSMPAGVRLDAGQIDAVVAAVDAALAEADLTLDELDQAVWRACGAWAGELTMPAFNGWWPRWRQAIAAAAHRGALCFGPNRGRTVTYSAPRRRIPGFRPDPAETAVPALLRRYLHAYGPATPAQLARWLAVPPAWASAALADQDTETVELAGTESFVNPGDAEPGEDAVTGVHLLPYFDAYVVGAQPRELLFPPRAAQRALAGGTATGQAGNFPVLLVDGAVAGVWHQRRSGRRVAITVEPLRRLGAATRRALDDAVEQVGMILEGRPELTIASVTVGPHA